MPSQPTAPRKGAYVATITPPYRPGVMMSDDETTENPAAQAARGKLAAGQWLLPSELGALFGVSRFQVNRWLARGQVVIAGTPYPLHHRPRLLGSYREIDPEDITTALAAYDSAQRPDA